MALLEKSNSVLNHPHESLSEGRSLADKLRVDFAVTLVFSFLKIGTAPLLGALLARQLGPSGLGAFGALERAGAVVSAMFLIGAPGLIRYVAGGRDGDTRGSAVFWAYACLAAIGFALAGLATIAGILDSALAEARIANASAVVLVYVAATGVIRTTQGWIKGLGSILTFNVLGLLSQLAKIGIVAIAAGRISIAELVCSLVLAEAVISIITISHSRWRPMVPPLQEVRRAARTLVIYSVPRMPGGFGGPLLQSLGILYLTSIGNVEGAGAVLAGFIVMKLSGAVFGRLSVALMPHFSYQLARAGGHVDREVHQALRQIVSISFTLSVLGSLLVPYAMLVLTVPWLGSEFAFAIGAVSLLSAINGINFSYSLLSGVLNAKEVKPLNTINIWIAIVVTGSGILIAGNSLMGVALSHVIGYVVLAALTLLSIRRVYNIKLSTCDLIANVRLSSALVITILISSGVFGVSPVVVAITVVCSLVIGSVILVGNRVQWALAARTKVYTISRRIADVF